MKMLMTRRFGFWLNPMVWLTHDKGIISFRFAYWYVDIWFWGASCHKNTLGLCGFKLNKLLFFRPKSRKEADRLIESWRELESRPREDVPISEIHTWSSSHHD